MILEPDNGQVLHDGSKYPSPFTQLLALGWYDGPTEGLIRTRDLVWKFDMLDEIHNPDDLSLRIFALAPIATTAWDQLVAAIAQFQAPTWPVFLPRWEFPSDADKQATEVAADDVLQQAGTVEWIIAAEKLMHEIVAAKAATPGRLKDGMEWPAYLNLNQRSSVAQ